MNLQERKEILVRLSQFMQSADDEWMRTKQRATAENGWFTQEFIELTIHEMTVQFLAEETLQQLIERFGIPEENPSPKKIGIVMAGDLPMGGIVDLLSVFLTGHFAYIKLAPKDTVLPKYLLQKMAEWNPESVPYFTISDMLKNCTAYIASANTKTTNLFQQYFQKYPHIIRKRKTSVAILTGEETGEELEYLADDVYHFFGMSANNVTHLFVPQGYNFENLLAAFAKYNYLIDHSKYKNNYDYNLALLLLNKRFYMSNGSILLVEDESLFSPVSQLHYQYYNDAAMLRKKLSANQTIQNIVGKADVPFGKGWRKGKSRQNASDTIGFLVNLS